MNKIFLGTSFSGMVFGDTGEVVPEYRNFIEQILQGLRKEELEVFATVEDEGWKLTNQRLPEFGVQKDLDEMVSCDVFVALVDDRPSVGLEFEIGYAVAKGKKVILAQSSNQQLPYFNQGIISAGLVTLVVYSDFGALLSQLTVAINAPSA